MWTDWCATQDSSWQIEPEAVSPTRQRRADIVVISLDEEETTYSHEDGRVIRQVEIKHGRQLDVRTAWKIQDSVGKRLERDCFERHEERRGALRRILVAIQMDVQGVGQERACGSGLRLDLVGQLLALMVLILLDAQAGVMPIEIE